MDRATPRWLAPALACWLCACSWARFDELAEEAPVLTIESASDSRPASFGDALVGLLRPGSEGGSMLVALGNGGASLTTAVLTAAGRPTVSGSGSDELDRLGRPNRLHSLAAAPGPSTSMPLVYLGTGTAVRVIDSILYHPSHTISPDPAWGPAPADFGLALANADLGSGQDLLVGATDALVLIRFVKGGWPAVDRGRVLAGADWSPGACRSLASGSLGAEPALRVAAGLPEQNRVLVLLEPGACLEGGSCARLELVAPAGAESFGAAVLIGDFDPAPGNELLVGAPGWGPAQAGQVFIYRFGAADLVPGGNPPASTLQTPAGAQGFGAALVLGPIGDAPRLVVGAPLTTVEGAATAGALYLFDRERRNAQISLATAQADRRLGRGLALLPFRRPGDAAPGQVLAATGSQSVHLFFKNLVGNHTDLRVP